MELEPYRILVVPRGLLGSKIADICRGVFLQYNIITPAQTLGVILSSLLITIFSVELIFFIKQTETLHGGSGNIVWLYGTLPRGLCQ